MLVYGAKIIKWVRKKKDIQAIMWFLNFFLKYLCKI